MMGLFIKLFLSIAAFLLLPLVFRRIFFKTQPFVKGMLLSFTFNLFLLPLAAFSLAWLIHYYVSLYILAFIILPFAVFAIVHARMLVQDITLFWKNLLNHKSLSVVGIIIFSLFFFSFEGIGKGYWDTYIIAPAILMNNEKVNFLDISGNNIYDYDLKGKIPDNLIDNVFGLSTKDQRIGAPIFFSVAYLFFGGLGFRLFYALTALLCFLSFFLFIKDRINFYFAIFFSILLLLNPLTLSVNRLNANFLGMLIIIILFILIREKRWAIAGLFYGILGGIRYEALIFAPAISLFILLETKTLKSLFKFALFSFFLIVPILFWNNFAYGNPLAHPTQYSGLDGFRPTFEHSIMGLNFKFNGLLNYPFHDIFVRTPHYPFPNYFTLILTIISSFGIILTASAPFGILINRQKNFSLFLLLMFTSFFLFLAIQENWEELKTTFLLLILPIFLFWIANGFSYIIHSRSKLIFIIFILSMIVIIILLKSLSYVDFQADQRWYQRFPKASNSESGLYGLPENLRHEWHFFHTAESEEEYTTQKSIYTSLHFIPYIQYRFPDLKIISRELYFDHSLFNVWDYIYGE